MSLKKFLAVFLTISLLFVAISLGGCGGSSSKSYYNRNQNNNNQNGNQDSDVPENPDTPETPSTETEDESDFPSLSDVANSDEYTKIMNELEQDLQKEGIDIEKIPNIHYVFIISGDRAYIDDELTGSETKNSRISATLPADEINRITAQLLPYYESGDVIALLMPSEATVNDIYEAFGEDPLYFKSLTSGDSEEVYPEIYAIAKRYGNNAIHYFSYEIPGDIAILCEELKENISGDVFYNDKPENEDVYTGDDAFTETFHSLPSDDLRVHYLVQAHRYANFMSWVAHLDKYAEEQDKNATQAKARMSAESTSGNFINFNAQRAEVDCSYGGTQIPWDDARFKGDYRYDASIVYTIYSAHNFSDGDDYYLVKANGHCTPLSLWEGKIGGWDKCHLGHLGQFSMTTTINGATTSDVMMIANAPKSVNRTGSVTDGISTTIGGKVGGKVGTSDKGASGEVNAEISASLTYSHSKTWTTSEWRLNNQSGGITAKWQADFSDNGDYFANRDNGNINAAQKSRVDLDGEWIWRVYKNYWQKHSYIPIKAEANQDFANTRWEYHWYKSNENEWATFGWRNTRYFNMNRPPHVYVNQKAFNFGKDSGTAMFKLLCNNDYTINSDQTWCRISPEQRIGSDTGANEREIFIAVNAFNSDSTDFQTRTATITVKETSTGDTQIITVVQRNR